MLVKGEIGGQGTTSVSLLSPCRFVRFALALLFFSSSGVLDVPILGSFFRCSSVPLAFFISIFLLLDALADFYFRFPFLQLGR